MILLRNTDIDGLDQAQAVRITDPVRLFVFCSPKKRTKKDLAAFEIQLAVFLVPHTAYLVPAK
jgi:hypothetical protein